MVTGRGRGTAMVTGKGRRVVLVTGRGTVLVTGSRRGRGDWQLVCYRSTMGPHRR